jgi:osmotically inducible protein OsmC
MAEEKLRRASAVWQGDLLNGQGTMSTDSKALLEQPYSFATRFGDEPGTNPEELIAAAHAGCFSMAFANTLKKNGYQPQKITTHSTCSLTPKEGGGFAITKMVLHVQGQVPEIDEATFQQIAKEADKGCPVSNLLRECLQIEIIAKME